MTKKVLSCKKIQLIYMFFKLYDKNVIKNLFFLNIYLLIYGQISIVQMVFVFAKFMLYSSCTFFEMDNLLKCDYILKF